MTGQGAEDVWPSAAPPVAEPLIAWRLRHLAELPRVRADIRETLPPGTDPDVADKVILALDEMASNALRHGGGGVEAAIRLTDSGYLIEVTDAATARPPTPAVGRDPSQGGMGLYLIARMALRHGWHAVSGHKRVWAVLPRC